MLSTLALDGLVATIARDCRSGLSAEALREAVLPHLRRAVPIDALWWAVADPLTLLFTSAHGEELPSNSGPYFVRNEFLATDVNKWSDLARSPLNAGTLIQVTDGQPSKSERYREIFQPLGLEDELRVVLKVGGAAWGYLCLHRAAANTSFSHDEVQFVLRIAPHLAEGIRVGLLRASDEAVEKADGPGLLIIARDGSVVGMNGSAGRWLEELGGEADGSNLPLEVISVVTLLQGLSSAQPALPRARLRTRSGRWAQLHASWLTSGDGGQIAVIIEEGSTSDIAPLIMAAYRLTEREREITTLICQGRSTRDISARLHLSVDTVQDHLKSVFDRLGVRSRGEVVATLQLAALADRRQPLLHNEVTSRARDHK
jgi:DNA-binding CsgD family transcriptional regulator